MKRTIKIGIIQQTCTNDIRHNLSKLHRNIEQVAAAGAQLVVLQELHNTSYFCQTEDTDMFDLAEPVPGPSTQKNFKPLFTKFINPFSFTNRIILFIDFFNTK